MSTKPPLGVRVVVETIRFGNQPSPTTRGNPRNHAPPDLSVARATSPESHVRERVHFLSVPTSPMMIPVAAVAAFSWAAFSAARRARSP